MLFPKRSKWQFPLRNTPKAIAAGASFTLFRFMRLPSCLILALSFDLLGLASFPLFAVFLYKAAFRAYRPRICRVTAAAIPNNVAFMVTCRLAANNAFGCYDSFAIDPFHLISSLLPPQSASPRWERASQVPSGGDARPRPNTCPKF